MKRRTKIIISILFTVILIISILLNIVLGIKAGIIKDMEILSGSVNESWKKTDTNIATSSLVSNKFYSSEGDDCIYNVFFNKTKYDNDYYITYDLDFNIADDFEVYFVLSNNQKQTYSTPIKKSHSPVGGDSISFTIDPNQFTHGGIRIIEVWARTID